MAKRDERIMHAPFSTAQKASDMYHDNMAV